MTATKGTFIDKARRVGMTLGTLIGVCSFMAGAGVTWGVMRSDLAKVIGDVKKQEERAEKHDARMDKFDTRQQTMEVDVAGRLARIEAKLDVIGSKP